MRLLLTNDDGIFAPGLAALHEALSPIGDIDVVAPDAVRSGCSHTVTIHHPVLWKTVRINDRFEGISVSGSPADCVKLAINELLPEKPDLVVSGINAGLNTGIHVIYSGTVAAAIEGAILGCPAFAISLKLYRDMDFAAAGRIARRLIERFVERGLRGGQVFNVNIPEIGLGRPRGVKVAPQSTQPPQDRIERRADPNGREYYWLSGDFAESDNHRDTDLHAVREGYVAISPLQFNLTDQSALKELGAWDWPAME